ncbi:MAG: hypothetical protein D6732_16090, partial [Methanobacteriota archaeon]
MSSHTKKILDYFNRGETENGVVLASTLSDTLLGTIWKIRFYALKNDRDGMFFGLNSIDPQDFKERTKLKIEFQLMIILAYTLKGEEEIAFEKLKQLKSDEIQPEWAYLNGLFNYINGIQNLLQGNLNQAKSFLEKATKYFRQTEFGVLLVKTLLNLGTVMIYLNEFLKAERIYDEAIVVSSKYGNEKLKFKSQQYLLSITFEKGDIEACLTYDQMIAPRINSEKVEFQDLVEYCTIIGLCFKMNGQYKKALDELGKALEFARIYRINSAFPHLLSEISIIYFELGDLDTAMLNIKEAILLCDTTNRPEDLFLFETRRRIIENEIKGSTVEDTEWVSRIEEIARRISFRFLLPETIFQILLIMFYLNIPSLEKKIDEGIEVFRTRFGNSIPTLQIKLEILEMYSYLNKILNHGTMEFNFLDDKTNVLQYSDKRLMKLAIVLQIQIRLLEYKLEATNDLETRLKKLIEELLSIAEKDRSIQFKISSKILSSKVFWLFRDVPKSLNLFDEAKDIADEKGMNYQSQLIEVHKKSMINELKEWKKISLLLDQQLKVYEKSDLMAYAKKVSKIIS